MRAAEAPLKDRPTTSVVTKWSAELTTAELYGLLRLRSRVFVVEQNCAYLDLDRRDLEPTTRHLWVAGEGASREPLSCLRLLDEGHGTWHIGRVCTDPAARGRGLSRELIQRALALVGDAVCVLNAQTYLKDFYASFGFVAEGADFMDDGILHTPMRRGARSIGP